MIPCKFTFLLGLSISSRPTVVLLYCQSIRKCAVQDFVGRFLPPVELTRWKNSYVTANVPVLSHVFGWKILNEML